MKKGFVSAAAAALLTVSVGAAAHHSFSIYDMQTSIEFEGVVETLKFRNPHMAMTMIVTDENGEQRTINFVEGAPANMLVRRGLDPALIQPGKTIKAVGSPRNDDPDAYFLKTIILEDGTRFQILN